MEPDAARSELADRVEERRDSLMECWGAVFHRVCDPIRVPEHDFPETPDDIFPWISVCFVVDDERILLVRDSGHSFSREPPGGKGETRSGSKSASGEPREVPAETAMRETREEASIECEVTHLLFTETH